VAEGSGAGSSRELEEWQGEGNTASCPKSRRFRDYS
jgi:hypothetical protein